MLWVVGFTRPQANQYGFHCSPVVSVAQQLDYVSDVVNRVVR